MYWPKAALIALYYKIIPPTMPRLRMSLYIVTAFVLACAVCTCLLDTLWCAPNISSNWSLEEGACSTFNSLRVLQIDWALNFTSDIASKHSSRSYNRLWEVANHFCSSLRSSFPAPPPSPSWLKANLRTSRYIRTWPRDYRCQPRSLHHNPDWQQLECRLHLVHGRNGRRYHCCLLASAENSPPSQESDFNILKLVFQWTSLRYKFVTSEISVREKRPYGRFGK